ncbi:MAG TPA: PAS domain S-box protein [Verrucomicrobiae bacterium]|nr:PAS domain S-box protein [Verrucomicrobiae bacterium]
MKPIDPEKMSREELIARLKAVESARVTISADHAKELSTQQALAQAAVKDREERLRAILETAVEGIITIDEHGIIESVNAAAERIFGYSSAEIIGKNVSLLMPSPHREAHDGYLDNYLRTGHAKIIGIGREVAGRRKDGTIFPMDLSVSEVKLAARRVFTGFIRDITERKQLEKEILEISDREQRRIGQDLHDGLCQHLAGIELMSQVLAQKLTTKSKAHAKQVSEIASHVRDAISHTRSLARGLSPVTIESEGLMSALHELATNTEKIFHVQCRCDFDEPVAIHDHALATHLFRIAQEAVSNAIKHGKAKLIVIKLRKTRGRVVLEIDDNGSGLRKNSTNHKGMGLRIMQSRASMIGGTMAIEPNRDGGVSVICAIPEDRVVLKH